MPIVRQSCELSFNSRSYRWWKESCLKFGLKFFYTFQQSDKFSYFLKFVSYKALFNPYEDPSLVSTLFTICEKCHAINDTISVLLSEFATDQISLEFCRFFRVVVTLYSMSDYRNAIGLPAQTLAVKMLTKIRARNLPDLALGVYLCSLLLESVRLSGRYIPEVFIFLQSVISLGLESDERPKRVFPSFRLTRNAIQVEEAHNQVDLTVEPSGSDVIYGAVKLVTKASEAKSTLAAGAEIYLEFSKVITELPFEEQFKNDALAALEKVIKTQKTSISRKKKVKMIQMYEPKIEAPGSRAESRKARELKNLKKEVKSKFHPKWTGGYFLFQRKNVAHGKRSNSMPPVLRRRSLELKCVGIRSERILQRVFWVNWRPKKATSRRRRGQNTICSPIYDKTTEPKFNLFFFFQISPVAASSKTCP